MQLTQKLVFMLLLTLTLAACKKEKISPNDVGGDTNIPLNDVGRQSLVYLNIGSTYTNGSMTVTSSNQGVVNYHLIADLTGNPDSALIASLVPAEFKNTQGQIEVDFKLKMTSEGIVDYFMNKQPRLLVKYNDNVGAQYTFKDVDGKEYVRTVTEKTGLDDWPYGFMYIKTIKVEEDLPANSYGVTHVTYRANHRFGLVYIEATTSTTPISISLFPQGV
jgi:hypothetical protein